MGTGRAALVGTIGMTGIDEERRGGGPDGGAAVTSTLSRWVRELSTVSVADESLVGGKAANLGELIGAGFPVPGGFVLTAGSYLDSMERGGVRDELARAHAEAVATRSDDPSDLDGRCARMAELVRDAGLSGPLASEIRAAYAALDDAESDGRDGSGSVTVAVRSSAVGEDAADASFAGMNATFTNVRGAARTCT